MTTDQHIDKLEKDINGVKIDIRDVKDQLDKLIILIEAMNRGLYGDEENDHIGVIDRQKLLDKEVQDLKKEILDIHKKNIEQDIALQAKNTIKNDLVEKGKDIIAWGIKIIVAIAIYKGTIGPDALL